MIDGKMLSVDLLYWMFYEMVKNIKYVSIRWVKPLNFQLNLERLLFMLLFVLLLIHRIVYRYIDINLSISIQINRNVYHKPNIVRSMVCPKQTHKAFNNTCNR